MNPPRNTPDSALKFSLLQRRKAEPGKEKSGLVEQSVVQPSFVEKGDDDHRIICDLRKKLYAEKLLDQRFVFEFSALTGAMA
jgi:hypothetical protein